MTESKANVMRKRQATIRDWIRSHRLVTVDIVLVVGALVALIISAVTSIPRVGFTRWLGVDNKTVWDVAQLAGIPLALAVAAYAFNRSERETDREIAGQRLREAALQAYLDRMTELLLEKGLSDAPSEKNGPALLVARTRTLTVLPGLDAERKGSVVRFLYEADLLKKGTSILAPEKDKQRGADLSGAALRRAYLSDSDLSWADLSGADLTSTNLFKAVLTGAKLSGADLTDAYLRGADVTRDQLDAAASLSGATMPDGTKHE